MKANCPTHALCTGLPASLGALCIAPVASAWTNKRGHCAWGATHRKFGINLDQ